MKKHPYRLMVCLFVLLLSSGCATALVVGGAAVGAGTGTYLYVNGELRTDYFASFDQVWSACEKSIAELRGTEVQPSKEIARGKVTAVINDEKVSFEVTYRSKNQTSVAIRVGLIGNKQSSQLLHDKIASHLAKQ
jgi:ribosomal protein L27